MPQAAFAKPALLRRTSRAALLLGSLLALTASVSAEDSHYTQKIAPLLRERCYSCHSHAAKKSRGGLVVDSREALLAGGDSGPAIVPGKPEESLLLGAVKRTGLEMPPEGKGAPLTGPEIALLEEWVRAGAPAPAAKGDGAAPRRQPGVITDEDRTWWAFQPLRMTPPPAPREPYPARNAIDHFIAARLDEAGLLPAPEASLEALLRRVTFDLTGLPPTAEEVDRFLAAAQQSNDAYEAVVDELLSRPAYGERMARWWLDLVRYSDGDGFRADDYRPHAWRYRDYVIESFNDDKPYARFVQEQIAGDELDPDDPQAIIATGYLRHGIYEWNARDVRGQWDNILNDITDTTGDVFFGLGLQCARCHDHKFDPILQRDYFRLRAVFAAFQPGDVPAASAVERAAYAEQLAAWEQKTAALRGEIAALEQPYLDRAEREAVGRFPEDIQAMIRKPAAQREPLEAQLAALAWRQVIYDWERIDRGFKGEDKERILALRRELANLEAEKPPPLPIAFAAADVGPRAPPVTIPKKPEWGEIEPGVLTILDPAPLDVSPLPTSTGRRAALARWLTAPDNPLTARVIVNRVWQQHFGKGLAANASDFGMLGEKPSHPELLDYLARWFLEEGGSLKKLHRLIVTSAAYRRGAAHPAPDAGRRIDPENRLLWRRLPMRLDAEQIRDAMLSVSGELQPVAGGPGRPTDAPVRTIYTRFMRNTRDPLADAFDAPLWFTSASSRDTTTTPMQSLLLVNSAALAARGRAFATRLEALSARPEEQVAAAYALALGRAPRNEERTAALQFLQTQAALADPDRITSGQAAFLSAKIPYRDGQGALLSLGGPQPYFRAAQSEAVDLSQGFTIEAFVVPRSIAETGSLRTIAAKWNGDHRQGGWTLGVTGKKSRRKPQTIVLQIIGRHRDGQLREAALFSDFDLQLNKPYFVAAAFTPATADKPGSVQFKLKDLSNDDEPLLSAEAAHDLVEGWENQLPLTLGGRHGADSHSFDGVLDDVRLSGAPLVQEDLLYSAERVGEATLGYWRFEAKPDLLADSGPAGRALSRAPTPKQESARSLTPSQAALADFCQALLNASEFLYAE